MTMQLTLALAYAFVSVAKFKHTSKSPDFYSKTFQGGLLTSFRVLRFLSVKQGFMILQ